MEEQNKITQPYKYSRSRSRSIILNLEAKRLGQPRYERICFKKCSKEIRYQELDGQADNQKIQKRLDIFLV